MAAPDMPEVGRRYGVHELPVRPLGDDGATEVDRLAVRWAALAPTRELSRAALHDRLAALLHRIAARCHDEPFWPSHARLLGADVLRSGVGGTAAGPLHPAEDVLAPTLALLREEMPDALGLTGAARERLTVVLDELAAGFAAALRDRVHRAHASLLRTRLADAAARDALTQLPNRADTEQRVHSAFAAFPVGRPGGVGLCALDLDGFASVNDRLGRRVGDLLLIAVATRLREAVAPHLLTRTGGDEFTVLVDDAADTGAMHALGCRIQDALRAPFRIDDRAVTLSAGVGVAFSAPWPAGPAELMRAADVALSWAKAQGRGRVVLFDADQDAAESARAGLLAEMDDALARGEFRLHYQPLVRLSDGRVQGAEALVRWQHPEHGLLGPSSFVPAAERSGSIAALDRWVLEQACRQAAAWTRERGPAAPYVSVNVSPVELAEPGWAAEVVRVTQFTGIRPAQLQLEITEQAVLADEAASSAALTTLRDAGIRLALDDFGTGYSGLSWLRRFPVHAIKIDGSFVDGLRHVEPDPVDSAIVLAMIHLAHSMGLEVTAEWVETARQADYLEALGCDLGQGRLFGQTGPAAWVAEVAPRTISE